MEEYENIVMSILSNMFGKEVLQGNLMQKRVLKKLQFNIMTLKYLSDMTSRLVKGRKLKIP